MTRRMFPHKVTLIKKSDYSVVVVDGVYWHGSNTVGLSNQEMDKGNSIEIDVPLDKDQFEKRDMIIKGEVTLPTIHSVDDLEDYDYVTVASKDINDVGSEIDNVVLRCR